jgi:GTPase SAR1 family protein
MGGMCDGEEEPTPKQTPPPRTIIYKVILLGAAGVGKTSLIVQWSDGIFQAENNPFVLKTRTLTIQGKKMTVDVPDTAGLEVYVEYCLVAGKPGWVGERSYDLFIQA